MVFIVRSVQDAAWRCCLGAYKLWRYDPLVRTGLARLQGNASPEPELGLLPALVPDRSTACFDVGAHIGQYTYVLERIVGSERVYAFEPNPDSFRGLRRLFPDVQLHELGVSEGSSEGRLRVPFLEHAECPTRGTLEDAAEEGETGCAYHPVRTVSLDDFVREHGVGRVGFLKVDVEGHELRVVRGARGVLGEHRPVLLIEIEQRHHRQPVATVFEEILAGGYLGFFLDAEARRLLPLDRFSVVERQDRKLLGTGRYVNNFLFLPREREAGILAAAEARLR